MRYELTDHEWSAIKPMLPNKPRGVARVNDRRPQWHLLGFTVRGALAGPARDLRSIHHLLQSLCSLAAGGRLEQDHERAGWRS
jgi:transposase